MNLAQSLEWCRRGRLAKLAPGVVVLVMECRRVLGMGGVAPRVAIAVGGAGPLLGVLFWWAPPVVAAEAQVHLRCDGALIETQGAAQLKRTTGSLQVSLGLEADGPSADAALGTLQQRLASVRAALQRLDVQNLRVTSPSTWNRPAERGQPVAVQANLQVSGQLAPQNLQALVRQVGSLPGVRLAPVSTEADPKADAAVQRQLLREAFADARAQALILATVAGFGRVAPLELRFDGMERPVPMRAMVAAAPDAFNPDELPLPTDRLGLRVSFCAN